MHYRTFLPLIFFTIFVTSQVSARSRLRATIDCGIKSLEIPLSLESPRVYYCGKIISTYTHRAKISFDIPKNHNQNRFYILVTQEFDKVHKDSIDDETSQNTIDYLYVKNNEPYKFFVLDLISSHDSAGENTEKSGDVSAYQWEIHEERLDDNGIIPDTAIIVCYFPNMFTEIKGGSSLELPTLHFNIETLAYSSTDEALEASARLRIAAIDTDTFHAPIKQKIETKNNRLLIMDIA